MLIFRGGNWPEHRPWFVAMAVIALGAVGWYVAEGVRTQGWPGGGSLPGFVFGVAGGLIILFEMLLWVRKKYRVVRVGRAKLWMKAHIWLGLLSLPLLVLHSGFAWWNGPLGAVLMLVFLVVIASGIWGLALQQFLPTVLLQEVPAETIDSQIDRVLAHLHDEARQMVNETCGVEDTQPDGLNRAGGRVESKLVIGAVRSSGRVQGKVLRARSQVRRVPGAEPLLQVFEETVSPFLRARGPTNSPLAVARRASAWFQNLKTWLHPAAHGVVDLLQDVCDQKRQFDRQARLHTWLHAWLLVHLPLSVALLILMVVHVYYALRYS